MFQLRLCWAAPFAVMMAVLAGCSSSPAPISVSLSPASSKAIDQGLSVAITATVVNSSKGVTWSLKGPGSLSAVTGQSVTYVSPASPIAGTMQATVTAAPVADPSTSASLAITVNPGLAIPAAQTLANGTVDVPYSQTVSATGGTAPFQWSIYNGPIETGWQVGGSVPNGLVLDPTTGTITGTPAAAGTWYFEATVSDADSENAIDGFLSIQINPGAQAEANPVPFLNQPLTPGAVAPGGAGITLSVSGTSFVSGSTVDFNGTPLTTTFVDGEHLTALVPAASVATAQTASVTVVNPAPGVSSSNAVYFQVAAREPSVSFANAPNSPLQIAEAGQLAAADFNQDGKPDLAVAGGAGGLYTMLGTGNGTFTPAPDSPERMPSPPYDDAATPYIASMTVGDFNHSGHPGLAIAEPNNEAAVILLGDGNGTFAASSAVFANAEGSNTTGAVTADFNADGNLDLAMINSPLGISPVALGYGSGAFNTAGDLYTQGFPAGAAVGDFNGDGKLDVAVADGGSAKYPQSGVAVSLGKGDGTFTQASTSPISVGQNLSAIVAADFNGDGKLDLAVSDADSNQVFVLLGNGNGTFQAPIATAVGNGPMAMAAGDFNNDGNIDLAVANYGEGTVTLLLGHGDGTFTEASGSPYSSGKGPVAIAAADFNGDGKLDLAVANSTDETVSILLQQ